MVNFEIKNYGNNVVMLVRTKSIEPSKGLPPTSSQCIIMNEEDIEILTRTLKEYANERRN